MSTAAYFYPFSVNCPSAGDYKTRLQNTWPGYKSKFIDAYSTGLVHDPSRIDDPTTTDINEAEWATSESSGYGMLTSVYMNDQTYFDKILDATYTYMYNKNGKGHGLFTWQVDKNGNISPSENDSATDGDIFIALALVYADTLVNKGYWTETGRNYGAKAQSIINSIHQYDIRAGRYLKPGDGNYWETGGGANATNPSYCFTAAMKVFDEYESTHHDWTTVIDQCYWLIQSVHPGGTDGYFYGLTPDWGNYSGGALPAGTVKTTTPSGNGYDMWYESIRDPWMMSLDAIWYNDPRAIAYCQNGMNFLGNKYGSATLAAQNAILYRMDGYAYGSSDNAWHNEMTVGMWSAGSMGSGMTAYQTAFNSEYNNFSGFTGSGFWGNWSGAVTYYYNQSLGNFGALVTGGNFFNVFKELQLAGTATATPTGTSVLSPTPSPTRTASMTTTPVLSPTVSPTATKTTTRTPTPAVSPTATPTSTATAAPQATFTPQTEEIKRPELVRCYPNPFKNNVSFAFRLDKDYASVKIGVFTLAGRKIFETQTQNQGKGIYTTSWSGNTNYGKEAPKGLYLVTLEIDGKATNWKKIIKSE